MKKLLSLVTALALVFSSTLAGYAADEATVAITISITHSKDIEVGGSANLTVNPGETNISGAITVKNIGTGIDETITLSDVTVPPAGWTLKFHFTDANTAPAADSTGWKDLPDAKVIAYGVTTYLWIKLGVPNPTSVESQAISIKINAD